MSWHRALACTVSALWMVLGCGADGEGRPVAAADPGTGGAASAAPNGPAGTLAPPGGAPARPDGNPPGSSAEGAALPSTLEVSGDVPCEVAEIVREHCTTCHGDVPAFNAPMSLTSAAAFNATAPLAGPSPVRSVAARRINADGAARMPPPGTVEALDAAELATLTAWLDAGATPVPQGGCAIIEAAEGAPGAVAELLPRPTTTGTLLGPYEGWDEGVECYPFVTYEPGEEGAPYRVGVAVDQYVGFGFAPPWQGTRFVRAFRTVIDNEQVLHHWILFEEPDAVDGDVSEVIGAHPGGAMMHGWAPGGSDLYFSPDLGMRMDSDSNYLLEVHYNSSDPAAVDASGLEICVAETPPENEAIISWLGTDSIGGTSATGTCRPRSDEPIHIVAGTPHMHVKGTHMTVTLNRADGGSEVLHDEPFSFQNQRGYAEDIIVRPGDSLVTECTYAAPATFGRGTNEEMCYWFALAYPAGALTDNGLIGALTHGANACLGR